MLKIEITDWLPKRIIMFTGLEWAKPFIEYLGIMFYAESCRKDVEYVGVYKDKLGHESKIVISKHPQGKKEDRLVEAIIFAFANN